jgi:hypothetical protein
MENGSVKHGRIAVRLIHQRAGEAVPRVEQLGRLGFDAAFDPLASTPLFRAIDAQAPAVIVVDLTRMPSHGLHYGHALRRRKSTRFTPLVFAGGEAEKVGKVRALLPDAVYCEWDAIGTAIRHAAGNAPGKPVVPPDMPMSKPGRLLVGKLGVKPGMKVVLIDAPRHAESLIEPLPEGVRIVHGREKGDLLIWFAGDPDLFQSSVAEVFRIAGSVPVWIAWPKQASPSFAGLTQSIIRQTSIDLGWVDYKICLIDATWSGLLFQRRKTK